MPPKRPKHRLLLRHNLGGRPGDAVRFHSPAVSQPPTTRPAIPIPSPAADESALTRAPKGTSPTRPSPPPAEKEESGHLPSPAVSQPPTTSPAIPIPSPAADESALTRAPKGTSPTRPSPPPAEKEESGHLPSPATAKEDDAIESDVQDMAAVVEVEETKGSMKEGEASKEIPFEVDAFLQAEFERIVIEFEELVKEGAIRDGIMAEVQQIVIDGARREEEAKLMVQEIPKTDPREEASSQEISEMADLKRTRKVSAQREEDASRMMYYAVQKEKEAAKKMEYALSLIEQAEYKMQQMEGRIRGIERHNERHNQMQLNAMRQEMQRRIGEAYQNAQLWADSRIAFGIQDALKMAEYRMKEAVRRLGNDYIARQYNPFQDS